MPENSNPWIQGVRPISHLSPLSIVSSALFFNTGYNWSHAMLCLRETLTQLFTSLLKIILKKICQNSFLEHAFPLDSIYFCNVNKRHLSHICIQNKVEKRFWKVRDCDRGLLGFAHKLWRDKQTWQEDRCWNWTNWWCLVKPTRCSWLSSISSYENKLTQFVSDLESNHECLLQISQFGNISIFSFPLKRCAFNLPGSKIILSLLPQHRF